MALVESRSKTRSANMGAAGASLGVALVIGEVFFKFHSFTLEVLAFLPTWGVLYTVAKWVVGLFDRN